MSNITLEPVAGVRYPVQNILVKMPKTMLAELDAAAATFHRPRNHMIRQAIVDYLAYLAVLSSAGNNYEKGAPAPVPIPTSLLKAFSSIGETHA